mgnify:CR=1 FL=1
MKKIIPLIFFLKISEINFHFIFFLSQQIELKQYIIELIIKNQYIFSIFKT